MRLETISDEFGLHCQARMEEFQHHCYPSLEWSSNETDSITKVLNFLEDKKIKNLLASFQGLMVALKRASVIGHVPSNT